MRSCRGFVVSSAILRVAASPTGGSALDKLPGSSCCFVLLDRGQQSDGVPVLGDDDPLPILDSLQVIGQVIL